MVKVTTACLAAAALTLAGAAGAKDVDSWEVNTAPKGCMMLSTFEDDLSIGLLWSAETKGLSFIASGDGLAALAPKGGKVSLGLAFAGKAPHNDWTDEAARVIPKDNGQVSVIADWGAGYSKELADTVTASKSVTVRVGDKVIGTYDLAGSPAAYRELNRCGGQLAAR